jgi:hypothetical protein
MLTMKIFDITQTKDKSKNLMVVLLLALLRDRE